MEMMDHLMAEKLTKIIKTAKWGKSHQNNLFRRCCHKKNYKDPHVCHMQGNLGETDKL